MLKRLVTLSLAILLSFSFTACSEIDKEQGTSNADSAELHFAEDAVAKAQERKNNILNSPTLIEKGNEFVPGESYSGIAYYVSNSGDDSRDGRSPETAWKTVAKVNGTRLAHGDAVFFNRGDIWRGETVETQPGVTYSAYGEGAKPRIVASPENGGDEQYWSLWWQGDNGEKIWIYHRDMPDCGKIVLNEEIDTYKILGFWNGEKYLNYIGENDGNCPEGFDIDVQLAQPEFDVKERLAENLTFFSEASSTLPDTLPIFLVGWNVDGGQYAQTSVGPLYFRCDEGNPGSIYKNIEFQVQTPLFDNVAEDCVVDNLFIGFAGDSVATINEFDNVTVQNCEIGWVGGIVGAYNGGDEMTSYGTGIQVLAGSLGTSGSGTRILNNVVHDMHHAGGGIEIFAEQKDELKCTTNVLTKGNLYYNCASGVTFFNWDEEPNPEHMFKNCIYEDNYLFFIGLEEWQDSGYAPAFVHEGGPNMQEGCEIRNNIFCVARTGLVYIQHYVPEYLPKFVDNTYIQYKDFPIVFSEEEDIGEVFDTTEALKLLGDNDATLVITPEIPTGIK